nr:nucleotide-binding, alpha-beta plait [Tanacetum cinerariifolium]
MQFSSYHCDNQPYGGNRPYGGDRSYGGMRPYGVDRSYGGERPFGDLKKTFEDYMLLSHTYYEFAKGRMPNKYTEGMGAFEDQEKGFVDHFSTTVAGCRTSKPKEWVPLRIKKKDLLIILAQLLQCISSRTRKCFTTMSKIDRNKLHYMGIVDGNNCGGYEKISQTGEWMEIAMYYGFPNYCDEDLKKTFEDYLLLSHTYYEFAKGGMPNKYTEGMGTFEDQAKGFADHFSTTVAGMDVANKHVSNNKAIKKIKKEDDNFVII